MTVEAIYHNGVIKPLTDLHLRENERISLRIERHCNTTQVKEDTRNIVHLRGIWKSHLTTAEKTGDWVSETIAAIRRESDPRIERAAHAIGEALHNA